MRMGFVCLFERVAVANRTIITKSKKKGDSYVRTDDDVELLLGVTPKYKVNKCQENFDWKLCQKCNNI